VRGDIDKYIELTRHGKDYLLMNPFGGAPTRGFDDTPERREGMKKFFKNGTLEQEVVATWESGDLAVLVTIERAHVEIGGLPEQDWGLRVTQVFRQAVAARPSARGSAREQDHGAAGRGARARNRSLMPRRSRVWARAQTVARARYSFTFTWSVIQFTSHVFPPSSEYDCSKCGELVVVAVQV
jgi:ketosteroid isomerase-like protein